MISSKVLVLNKNWNAVGVATLQRCIALLHSQYEDETPKAHIITPPPKGEYEIWTWEKWAELKPEDGENGIIASSKIYRTPEVILLSRYDSVPIQKVNFCRRVLWKRDNYRCQYCGVKPNCDECTLDHVLPRSRGGETSWYNCVLACYQCNSQKADKEPHEAFKPKDKERARLWKGPSPMKLLKQPIKPEFSIFRGNRVKILDTWKHWIDRLYWDISLDNDMEEEYIDFESI